MSTLSSGQALLPGQTLQSDDNKKMLKMQSDGNVVLYYESFNNPDLPLPLWQTNTAGINAREFIMQTDGNLVLYDTSGQWHWASGTHGNPGAFLNMQDDGNLVVYKAGSATETGNNALWDTGTRVPPLTLSTEVDNGEMLNVGNANLPGLSYYMLFNQNANSGGIDAYYTEQGSWSVFSAGPVQCGSTLVTVNAHITANWSGGSNSVGSWTWQDLQQAFASALGTAMQHASNPTAYQNYSYTELATGEGALCVDPQPTDWGQYIPAAIQITAYNNAPENAAQQGQVTLTYSTDQGGGDVGDACGAITAADGVLAIFDVAAPLAAVVGAFTGIFCSAL